MGLQAFTNCSDIYLKVPKTVLGHTLLELVNQFMQQGFKKIYRFCLQAVFIDVIVLTFRASGKSIGGLVVKALTC